MGARGGRRIPSSGGYLFTWWAGISGTPIYYLRINRAFSDVEPGQPGLTWYQVLSSSLQPRPRLEYTPTSHDGREP